MGTEENKKTVRRYIEEILNNLDYAHAKEIVHEGFFGQGLGISSLEEHEKYFKAQREQIPDIKTTLEETIAEGDKVVAICTNSFTDTAGNFGNPPSNKLLSFRTIIIYTLKDGRIVKGEPLSDVLTAIRQTGATTINLS